MTGNRNFTIVDGVTTVTGSTGAIKATSDKIALAFDFTAVAGTAASVAIKVEWSPDGVNFGPAATPDTMPAVTAVSVVMKEFTVKAAYYKVTWTLTGDVSEIQAVEHNHTGGTFTLTFDGQGPTAALDWDAPNDSIAAEGTLTVDTQPLAVIAAQGELTMDIKPINGDTLTVDARVYTFEDTLTNVDGNVAIGLTLATAQENLVAAINREAGYGTKYAALTLQHATVRIAAFATNAAILTAVTGGTGGNSIATTETFNGVTNVFDATTLGTTTAGAAADTVTVDGVAYTFVAAASTETDEIFVGADLAAAKVNIVAKLDANVTVSCADFISNDAILTARTVGTAGNALATTETFTAVTNIFDATTLGTTTLGVNGVETELELLSNIDGVSVVRNAAGDWDVTWPSADGNVALMTIQSGSLTGGSTATVTQSTPGVEATVTVKGVSTHFDRR